MSILYNYNLFKNNCQYFLAFSLKYIYKKYKFNDWFIYLLGNNFQKNHLSYLDVAGLQL